MSQASVHEQAYHLLINTALTYQQIADELKSSAHGTTEKERTVLFIQVVLQQTMTAMLQSINLAGLQEHAETLVKFLCIMLLFAKETV